jgi:cell division protein ZapA
MAQVNVTINNRTYRMACNDGEEDHLRELAVRLNELIDQYRAEFGEIGDARLTVMAAIKMADDFDNAQRNLARLQEELARMSEANSAAQDAADAARNSAAEAIAEAAARISAATRKLALGPSEGVA